MSTITRKKTKGLLVLRVAPGDGVVINSDVEIIVGEIEGKRRVKLVVTAPKDTKVRRKFYEKARDEVKREDPEEA